MKLKNLLMTVFSVIMIVALSAFITSCTEGTTDESTGESNTGVTSGYTVTYYRGTTVLKTENVEEGGKAINWTPEVDGYEFQGWYAEASLSIAFDFDAVITEDTDVFAAFRENVYVEDTNAYYAIGGGSGELKATNWDHALAAAALPLTKDTTITDANVYTVEIDMYAGDRFQICYGGGWSGQQGIGYVVGFEYCAGTNPNSGLEVTAEDRDYGEVKDADGNVVFIGGNEYDNGAENWNIILNEGHDGTYKFTLTTYPNAASYNTITWELVATLTPQETTHDMKFIGTMNEWSTENFEGLALDKSQDGETWTGIITITEDMYADWTAGDAANNLGVECAALKIYNTIDGAYYGINGQNIFLTAGTYAFKYTVATNAVEYQALAYYIVGTYFADDGTAVNYAVKVGVTPEMTVVDGVATATITVTDVTDSNEYNWIKDQGKTDAAGNAAGFALKVVYGCEIAIKDWYGDTAANGDNFYVTAGTYTVTFDIATGAVTITAA